MRYTRMQWVEEFLHYAGNDTPHPYIKKWVYEWTRAETGGPDDWALNNLLNTTEGGFGSDLFPDFNSVGVKRFPTMQDGCAANAAVLMNGMYPHLWEALRLNHGAALQAVTPEIQSELATWCGDCEYSHNGSITVEANKLDTLPSGEVFTGRKCGEKN